MSTVFAALLLAALPAGDTDNMTTFDVLEVDPLLIEQAAEVWRLLATEENRVWPGWNAATTPLLFYLPNKQDVLINHPDPPDGFRAYHGLIQFPHGTILVRDGKTLIELDGQNTSLAINEVQTLVVADTLSNRMNNVRSMIQDPRPASEKLETLSYDRIGNDPISTLGMIAHEAFHVFQHAQAPDKGGNELDLMQYPTLSVKNNVGFVLEAEALAEALQASDLAVMRQAAVHWLAVRQWRRSELPARARVYEDGTEFNEGLAKYIEYRLTQVLEDVRPSDAMWRIQGFRGYADLSWKRAQLIEQMQRMLRGEVNVNNDPYGASPARMRLYYSGMAIAALLDRLSDDWHAKILQPDTTLTGLVQSALDVTPEQLSKQAGSIEQGDRYAQLAAVKSELRRKGDVAVQNMLSEIQHGPHTALMIDYSALEDAELSMAFTPFGIQPVDEHRAIFHLVPISAKIGSCLQLRQTRPSPILRDDQARQLVFQLRELVSQQQLLDALGVQSLSSDPITAKTLTLPGVELSLEGAIVAWQASRIEIRLGKP